MLLQTQRSITDLPLQLNQILLDLENGQLEIVQRDPEASVLRREVRHAGLRVAMALCVTALAVTGGTLVAGWAVTAGAQSVPHGDWLLFSGVSSLVVAGLCWLLLLAHTIFAATDGQRSAGSQFAAFARFFMGRS